MAWPDPPKRPDPLYETWAAGREMARVFDLRWGARGFNPTDASGRFRPVWQSTVTANRLAAPTMYAAADRETALAEGLLRGFDSGGTRQRLYAFEVEGRGFSMVRAERDLQLVRLHGSGLKRLGLTRGELIDSDRNAYEWTAKWAQALYDLPSRPDGLVWTSRQNDSAAALILWGDRVEEKDLVPVGDLLELGRGTGLDLVREACLLSGMDFEG